MEKFDTDKDGKASKSEFIAAAGQLSAQADDDETDDEEDEENNEEDGEEWTAASLLEVGDEDAAAEELSAQADEDGDEEYNEEEGEEQTAPSLLEVGEEDASVEELSVDEQAKLQQELEGEFKRLDTDADGFLDPTNELLFDENIDAKEKAALMEKFDTDKDGKASKSEFIAAAEQLSAQA